MIKIKDIVGMFSFYKKKALFFVFLFIAIGAFLYVRNQNTITADETIPDVSITQNQVQRNLVMREDGSVWEDNTKIGQTQPVDGKDEFRKSIVDKPEAYIESYGIILKLPKEVAKSAESKFLAIHGVGTYDVKEIDGSTIAFTAYDIGPQAQLSIVTKMPKGTIEYSSILAFKNGLFSLGFSFWLALAIILPGISIVSLIVILTRELKGGVEQPKKMITQPPMMLPPAIVGVIIKQKIGPREIAATLIDLALRGDIVIVDRDRGFAFGKNRLEHSLVGYEKVLLAKIFKESISADQKQIDERVNHYLYSKKISAFYYLIQALAYRMGYLRSDYQKIKTKYSLLGISLFILGIAGFLLKAFSVSSGPPYALFFWVGMTISAIFIYALADYIPSRTELAKSEATNWLAFKQFLSDPNPINFKEVDANLFAQYLPYAMVLECEAAWAQRFSKHNFTAPEWFLTDREAVGLEDFCLLLFPIVSYVGRNLDALKAPGI